MYRMHFISWGNLENHNKTLFCVHGLNRNCRDFDFIANYFVKLGYFIVAPDILGRGNSDYLEDNKFYDFKYYINDLMQLINTLNLKNINYLGNSMGGAFGLMLNPHVKLKSIILNDIGAKINKEGLLRIASYSGSQPDFKTYLEAKEYLIAIAQGFGNLEDEIWDFLVRHSFQKNKNGNYELKRDLNLFSQFIREFSSIDKITDYELWDFWSLIKIPSLIIKGIDSDILSENTIKQMMENRNNCDTYTINNCGHAPFLYKSEHLDTINKFLSKYN